MHKKLGLALSGGGARGFAHIGVLKILEQHQIYPQIITGTSMGGLIAAAYATGCSLDDLERRAIDGTTHQGVLQHTQIYTRLARVGTQGGDIPHLETTVLGDDDRLGARHFCGHFGDYRLLVVKIETHGQLLFKLQRRNSALAIRRPSFRNRDSRLRVTPSAPAVTTSIVTDTR